jgi:hypothetical protein
MEYKINILLRLTAELVLRDSGLPVADRVRLSARSMEWFGDRTPAVGTTGIAAVFINPALPQPVRLPCSVAGERTVDGIRGVELKFAGVSDSVSDLLEKLIFRQHRRLIAGARHTAG